MLGELAIGFDFNVRSWHRADKLTDLKVRYERRADIFPTDNSLALIDKINEEKVIVI